jgi:hypothetical protein
MPGGALLVTFMYLVCVELPDTELPQTEADETAEQVWKAIEDVLAIAFPRQPFKVNHLDSADDAATIFRYRQRQGASL